VHLAHARVNLAHAKVHRIICASFWCSGLPPRGAPGLPPCAWVCRRKRGFAAAGAQLCLHGRAQLATFSPSSVIAINLPVFGVPACRHKCPVLQVWARATCNVLHPASHFLAQRKIPANLGCVCGFVATGGGFAATGAHNLPQPFAHKLAPTGARLCHRGCSPLATRLPSHRCTALPPRVCTTCRLIVQHLVLYLPKCTASNLPLSGGGACAIEGARRCHRHQSALLATCPFGHTGLPPN
jgi:hypothetical protein